MIQIKYVRFLLVLVLGTGFLFSVVFSIIKWRKGNTGLTHEIRRQDLRVLPTISLMRRSAISGNASGNLTEEYLKIESLDQHVLHIRHYNIEHANGQVFHWLVVQLLKSLMYILNDCRTGEHRIISDLKSRHIKKRVIPDFRGTRLLQVATYDPKAPSKNNVAGAVSIITNWQSSIILQVCFRHM